MSTEPAVAKDAVLKRSEALAENTPQVSGYDFNEGLNYSKLFESYVNTGFQATNLGLAIREINRMGPAIGSGSNRQP
ncbi:probable deoxyhypusine synthase isoform X2 [Drosophila teissieri]|uniref:probable deoxyhypusine synthase isoform X2 n=1 Tax=Drosophila teissieri TaxID=7243 RepID=UPI001CB9FE81|nr:probable deoxyhypusine synthase isoform X2 [Drosophila teissieri]